MLSIYRDNSGTGSANMPRPERVEVEKAAERPENDFVTSHDQVAPAFRPVLRTSADIFVGLRKWRSK